jgi:AraC-like DNA-binding protein
MHLFSEQVGIPVRKFILWQRLKYALLMLADGSAITKAAHAAGFTDSAHMNRTFNAMFGIGPSEIFKNSRFIQFFAC